MRAADPEVAVLADGFSYRTQPRQPARGSRMHLALAATALGLPVNARPPAPATAGEPAFWLAHVSCAAGRLGVGSET